MIILSAMLMLSIEVHAQTASTGAITGTVLDQAGAALPGVEIAVTNEMTGETTIVVSNEVGVYTAPLLKPATYRLEFSRSGFRKHTVTGIKVVVTETSRVDVGLNVGEVSESVTVNAQPEILRTEDSALGRVVDEKQMTQLPLSNRNFTQVLALSPGTSVSVPDATAFGPNSQDISASGARPIYNNFYIDGIDANNFVSGFAGLPNFNGVAVLNPDVIKEFKVQTGLYDAAFGHNTGASISIITKSGGSRLHGSVFEFFRNEVLNANNFFFNKTGTRRPILRQNQFGGTVGGPLIPNRTFWFFAYQGTRQINGASIENSTSVAALPPVPTVRTRESLGAIFGGKTGTLGGTIAADGSNINPVALALLNAKFPNGQFVIPSPQIAGPGINFTASIPARYDENQFNINIDHNLTSKNSLAGRFFFSNSPRDLPFFRIFGVPASGNPPILPGFGESLKFGNRNLVITDVHIFGPNAVNEFRIGGTRILTNLIPDVTIRDKDIGLAKFSDGSVPEIPRIAVAGAFELGTDGLGRQSVHGTSYYVGDTFSYIFQGRGTHNVRMGGEVKRLQDNFSAPLAQVGTVGFLNFNDFLLGGVFLGFAGSGIANRNYRETQTAFFYQDNWKVDSKLTLNLGLRYEFNGLISDTRGALSNFEPSRFVLPPSGQSNNSGFVIARNVLSEFKSRLQGIPEVRETLYDPDKNNIGPRIGFAYKPHDKLGLVLRGGYGVYYEALTQGAVGFTTVFGPPFYLFGLQIFQGTFQNPLPNLPLAGQFPLLSTTMHSAPPFAAGTGPQSIRFLDNHIRSPYTQQYTFDVQWEIGRDYLLEIGYVGSRGTKLVRNYNMNLPRLASPQSPINGITENTPDNAALRVPFLGFSPEGLQITSTDGFSSYNSLQLSLTKRLSQGLQFLSSYTYAKTIDDVGDVSGINAQATTINGDHTNRRTARGVSSFDRTHRFVISYVYDLPRYTGKSALVKGVATGWQLAGITTIQSGTPFEILDPGGARLFGATTSRANFAPGASAETARLSGKPQDRLNRYFNTSAFAPAGMLFGNVGRDILRGPGQVNFDGSVLKRTPVTETKSIEFRAEFFNIFNNPNFANPGGVIGSPSFGVISQSSSSPRIVQFALKYIF
jgi:outer membrane receptor protein involved in Fe transport